MYCTGDILGLDEVNYTLRKFMEMPESRQTKNGVYECAKEIAMEIRANAPIGVTRVYRGKIHKAGSLRRSVVARLFAAPGVSIAFVAIDQKEAGYAHNVEYGHRNVVGGPLYRKKGRRNANDRKSKPSRRREGVVVGNTPPHPFFWPVGRRWDGPRYTAKMISIFDPQIREINNR